GLMVLSGVHGGRDAVLATVHERPDYLGADLRSLLDPHPAPVQDGAWWGCGAARARVVDGAVQLEQRSGGGDGLDGLRATCAAVWSAVDRGVAVDPASVPPFDDLVRSPGATAPSDRSDGASPFTVRGDVPAPAVHRPRGRGP